MSKGLADGRILLLAGSSAGAGGVLVNLDKITAMMHDRGSKIEVRGIVDSGWFLDNEPFQPHKSFSDDKLLAKGQSDQTNACSSPFNCSPLESVKRGMRLVKITSFFEFRRPTITTYLSGYGMVKFLSNVASSFLKNRGGATSVIECTPLL